MAFFGGYWEDDTAPDCIYVAQDYCYNVHFPSPGSIALFWSVQEVVLKDASMVGDHHGLQFVSRNSIFLVPHVWCCLVSSAGRVVLLPAVQTRQQHPA